MTMVNEDVLKIVFNNITFGQRKAASIVGGRPRLIRLIEKWLIRAEKKSKTQSGKWYCNGWDCIKHASCKYIVDDAS